MPSLTLIGLILWLFISLVAFGISGLLYYELINIWIPLVPLAIFFFAYILLLTLRLCNYTSVKAGVKLEVIDKKYFMVLNVVEKLSVRTGFFLIIIGLSMSIYVLTTLGVSFQEAQQLRNIFYSEEGNQLLGGSIFIWINWLVMGLAYMIFLTGISIAVTKKYVLNKSVILGFVVLVMFAVMTGGRGGIVNAMIFSLGGWLSVATFKDLKNKKIIKRFFFIASILFAILLIQFINRAEGPDLLITNTFVKYFVGPIFAFDQFIVNGIDDDIRSSIGRIGVAFSGLDTILISGFARGVLGLQAESVLASTSYYFHYGVNISDSEIMNAHYTGGARWYIDFGLFGYFLFFTLLASLCLYFDIKKARLAERKKAFGYPIIYTCTFVSVIYSSREFMFDSPEYYLAFVGMLLLYTLAKRSCTVYDKVIVAI